MALLSAVMLGGCVSRDPRGARFERVSSPGIQASLEPTVQLLDEQALHALIHERHGKTLFLNFWATWCQPCVAEFPDLVKLSESLSGSNVEVVGVSVDYPDEIESKVIPFLRKHRIPFKMYVAQFRKQEDFINAVDPSWNGAVPATFIYGPRGTQRYSLIGQGSYSRFKKEVEEVNGKRKN